MALELNVRYRVEVVSEGLDGGMLHLSHGDTANGLGCTVDILLSGAPISTAQVPAECVAAEE